MTFEAEFMNYLNTRCSVDGCDDYATHEQEFGYVCSGHLDAARPALALNG